MPVLTPTRSTRRSTPTRWPRPARCSAPARVIVDRRPLLHGAARPAGRAVLHARVVRQVHACREGTRWMVQILEQDRGRARATQRRPRPAARRLRPHPRQVPVPARRRGGMPVASYIDKFRAEFQEHVDAGRLPVRRRVVARGRRSPRSSSTHATGSRRGRSTVDAGVSAAGSWSRVTIDGRDGRQAPEGPGPRRDRRRGRGRDPGLLLRAAARPGVGACRMCLVEVEGMPKLQAGCTLTAQDGIVVKTAQTSEKAAEGQNGDARVPARQPPARLPGLRQGRRVPAPGPDVPLGPR